MASLHSKMVGPSQQEQSSPRNIRSSEKMISIQLKRGIPMPKQFYRLQLLLITYYNHNKNFTVFVCVFVCYHRISESDPSNQNNAFSVSSLLVQNDNQGIPRLRQSPHVTDSFENVIVMIRAEIAHLTCFQRLVDSNHGSEISLFIRTKQILLSLSGGV